MTAKQNSPKTGGGTESNHDAGVAMPGTRAAKDLAIGDIIQVDSLEGDQVVGCHRPKQSAVRQCDLFSIARFKAGVTLHTVFQVLVATSRASSWIARLALPCVGGSLPFGYPEPRHHDKAEALLR